MGVLMGDGVWCEMEIGGSGEKTDDGELGLKGARKGIWTGLSRSRRAGRSCSEGVVD